MTTSPAAQSFDDEDWPQNYEALLRTDRIQELRVNGFVHCWWDDVEELKARAEAAGMTNLQVSFDADCGSTLYLPRGGKRNHWYVEPIHQRCEDVLSLRRERAHARGHNTWWSGRRIGLRAALRCNNCGGRLYVDVARNLVCGELTRSEPCPAQPVSGFRRWWRRRRLSSAVHDSLGDRPAQPTAAV